jgi:hypothetical protein
MIVWILGGLAAFLATVWLWEWLDARSARRDRKPKR